MAGTRLCLVVFGCLAACGGSSKDELKITDVSVGSAQQSNGFMVTQMSMTVGRLIGLSRGRFAILLARGSACPVPSGPPIRVIMLRCGSFM